MTAPAFEGVRAERHPTVLALRVTYENAEHLALYNAADTEAGYVCPDAAHLVRASWEEPETDARTLRLPAKGVAFLRL